MCCTETRPKPSENRLKDVHVVMSENRVHRLCRENRLFSSMICSSEFWEGLLVRNHGLLITTYCGTFHRFTVNAREPVNTIVHSNRGSQFRSKHFTSELTKNGLRGSIGRVGAAGDNLLINATTSALLGVATLNSQFRSDLRLGYCLATPYQQPSRLHTPAAQRITKICTSTTPTRRTPAIT